MDQATLTLKTARTTVLPREAIELEATVQNKRPEPLTFSNGLSPISYEFHMTPGGRMEGPFSEAQYRTELLMAPQRPPDSETSVDAGASKTITDDPGLYAMGTLEPGRYSLIGHLMTRAGELVSAPLNIEVVKPRIGSAAGFYCPLGNSIPQGFAHTAEDGKIWILGQDALNGREGFGTFRRLASLDGNEPVSDLGLSIRTSSEGMGRWMVWLRGGSAGALLYWMKSTLWKAPETVLEVKDPRLVEPGFQMADGSAVFFVAGTVDKAAFIQTIQLKRGSVTISKPVQLSRARPERIIAQQGEDGTLNLIWSEKRPAGSRILARHVSLEGKPLDRAPRVVYESDSPLLALEAPALARLPWTGAVLDALFAPAKKQARGVRPAPEGWPYFGASSPEDVRRYAQRLAAQASRYRKPSETYAYVRVKLDGSIMKEAAIKPPSGPALSWALAALETNSTAVVVHTGRNLLYYVAGDREQWATLVSNVGSIRGLRAVSARHNYWAAEWVDSERGLRYAPDPEFTVSSRR